jgi:hypothetical protein
LLHLALKEGENYLRIAAKREDSNRYDNNRAEPHWRSNPSSLSAASSPLVDDIITLALST